MSLSRIRASHYCIQLVMSLLLVLLSAEMNYSFQRNNMIWSTQSISSGNRNCNKSSQWLNIYRTSKQQFHQHAQDLKDKLTRKVSALYGRRRTSSDGQLIRQRANYSKHITATNALLAINAMVFILSSVFLPSLNLRLMKINYKIARGEVYRLFTPLFLHGSISHILMNSISLNNLGPQAERMFGTRRFLMLYFGAGVFSNACTFAGGQSPYSLGASGCIFGLVGAFAAFYYKNRKSLGSISTAGLDNIKQNLLVNLIYGMLYQNIDTWGHVGGFIGGALLSLVLTPNVRRGRNGRLVEIRNRLGRRDGGGGLIPMGAVDLTEEDKWKIYGDLNED